MSETDTVFGPQPEHQPEHPPEHPDGSPSDGPPGDGPPPPERRRRGRRRLAVAAVGAAAVLALAALAPLVVERVAPEPPDRTLRRVRVVEGLRNDHTTEAVDYPSVPPLGGPHDPAWLDCGAYDSPVRDENAVHDLEHGSVWITYQSSLSDADVAALARELPDNGLLSPYVGLPSPVVVTVWGRQLRLTGADDPRLPVFIAAFGDGHTAPEPFASCAGGLAGGDSPGDSRQV